MRLLPVDTYSKPCMGSFFTTHHLEVLMRTTTLTQTLAATLLLSTTGAFATSPATSVDYGNIHGHMTVSDATFTSVGSGTFSGNTAVVKAGSDLSLSFKANIVDTNNSYCPGCIIQEYLAWTGSALTHGATPGQDNLFSGQIRSNINLGSETWTTKAPTTPGDYFIGAAGSLQYHYVPVTGGLGGPGSDLASFKVTVAAVPEPETSAMALVGLLVLSVAARRRCFLR